MEGYPLLEPGVGLDCMKAVPAFGGLVLQLADENWAEKIGLAGVVGISRVDRRHEEAALHPALAEKGWKILV